MATLTIQNVTEAFIKKVWENISFDSIIWLYWDSMDWCQYDQVIPDKEDIEAYKSLNKKEFIAEEFFFTQLMK